MNKNVISYDYSSVIPPEYLEQANDLVSYLEYYPFQRPTNCKRCDSTNFSEKQYRNPNSKRDIPSYFCRSCKRIFNQTTYTYFAGIVYLELFADFARLRFAGHSQETISNQLGFALATAKERDKLFLRIMADKYPELYSWWKSHQDYLNKALSSQVEQEKVLFMDWLKSYVNQKAITCPQCRQIIDDQIHQKITCPRCNLSFRVELAPYHHIFGHYADQWIQFAEGVIQGKSCMLLAKELKIGNHIAFAWKKVLLNQMQQFKFDKLLQWTRWQKSRYIAYQTKLSRERAK